MTLPATQPTEQLHRLRTKATRVIFAGAALGTTGIFAAFSLGPLVAFDITGSDGWAGVPGALAVAGTALGAFVLSAIMARYGRGPGLEAGYVVGLFGAVLSVVAIARANFVLLLTGMLLIGFAHGANQLARFAAADMHPVERRGRIVGWIVWAGTIGALIGPGSLEPLGPLARELEISPLAGGFIGGALLFAVAAIACAVGLRPDPRTLAAADTIDSGAPKTSLRSMMLLPHTKIALIILLGAQVAMISIMTMTPLHISHGGHGLGAIGFVLSTHFVGMFALAPLAGTLAGRLGVNRVVMIGSALLLGGALTAAFTPAETGLLLSLPLFLLGAGWCLCFVAASALLTRGLSYRERARLQGSVDGVVWAATAITSLGSGLIVETAGFTELCLLAAVAMALAALSIVRNQGVVGAPST